MKKILPLLVLAILSFAKPSHAVVGAALYFDGTNDYVDCGNILTASYTEEAWVKINASAPNNIISGGATGRHVLWAPTTYGNRLSAGHNGINNQVQDPTPLGTGIWYHVALTYDAATTTLKLYKNGILVSTNTNVPAYTGGNLVQIGSHGAGSFLTGYLDEVRLWNRALCASEIVNNRNCEVSVAGNGLLACYHFNQGTASGNNAGLTTLTDASGNGNNGTLINFALTGSTSNWVAPGAITSGMSCSAFSSPEIDVQGNAISIVDGDATPAAADNTDYGTMSVCSGTISKTFTITNTGIINLTISSVLISGANAADFTVTTPAGSPVAPSGSTSFVVRFNPSLAGTRVATITVNNNDCDEGAYDFAIQGNGTSVSLSAVSQTDISCNGGNNGSATVVASGGIAPLTYAWTPSGGTGTTASSLSAGSYTCTVTDANNCTATQTFSITEPALALSANGSQTDINCNGANDGTATVVASGGTPAYSYSWAPSGGSAATANGLAPGSYTCTVTDANGCTTTQSFTLTEPSSPLSATSSHTDVTCNGANSGSASVVASGGTPAYFYSWSPSGGTGATASSLAAGSYTCTIVDANGCTLNKTFTLTEPSAINISMSHVDATCTNSDGSATINATGGVGPYTYLWAPTGQTTAMASAIPSGSYTCTVTDANGCSSQGITTVNSIPCGPTQLAPASCGATLTMLNQPIYCNPSPGATNYRYKFMQGSTTVAIYTRGNNLTNCVLTNIPGITYGQTYQVTVSSMISNVWGTYGASCNLTTPAFPTTTVTAGNCGMTVSSMTSPINCNSVVGASNYQWKFMQGATLIGTYIRGTNLTDCQLANVPGIQYGQTFDVYVRAYVGGTWGSYGTSCNITSPPFPTTQVSAAYCGATLATISSGFSCDAVPGATNYQWKVVNTALGYSSTITTSNNLTTWRLSNHPGVIANTTYTVTVRANVNGWGPFGPACSLTTGHSSRLGNPDLEDGTIVSEDFTMSVFPNPVTDGNILLEFPGAGETSSLMTIEMYDAFGRVVYTEQVMYASGDVITLQPGDLASGIYILKATMNDKTAVNKVVIQK